MIRRSCSWPIASGALLLATASTLPGQTRQQVPPIEVGREVMVSGSDTMSAYSEYDADVDPTNPNRMIVCAQPYVPTFNERKGTVHISNDGGKTWRLALEVPPDRPGLTIGDPTCAFTLDGTAILSILYENADGNLGGAGVWDKWIGATGQLITRSSDGGKTWTQPYQVGFIDNQNLLVDRSNGPFRGRVYIYGSAGDNPFWLTYSTDTGRSFVRGELTAVSSGWEQADRGALLTDGTIIIPFMHDDPPDTSERGALPTTTLAVARSTDGGIHLSQPDTAFAHRTMCGGIPPQIEPLIAVDNSNGPFRGRVYLVWGELEQPSVGGAAPKGISSRCLPVISSSDNGGKKWTRPLQFVDAPFRHAPQPGPDARIPAIAVNSRGVVGVTWYDRRDDPEGHSARLRFTASLDGGDTWLPSVPVSSKELAVQGAHVYSVITRVSGGGHRQVNDILGEPPPPATDMTVTSMRAEVRQNPMGIGGDYSAMVADSGGAFHPFWVDNRGDAAKAGHLFTTAVNVSGEVYRNGAAELASLENVTRKVEFSYYYTKARWEGGYLNVDVGLVLTNVSSDTIVAPFKFRILGVRSFAGPVVLRDSGAGAAGSVLDLASVMTDGKLAPGALTKVYEIRLRAGPVPAALASDGPYGIGSFGGKVYAKVRSSGAPDAK